MGINSQEPRKSCEESDFCGYKCIEFPELCPTGYANFWFENNKDKNE